MHIRSRHVRRFWQCIRSFVSILLSVEVLFLPVNFSFLTATALASSSERIIPINSMVVAREGHTATPLADGRVLIAGGSDTNAVLASSEVFNPQTRAFPAGGAMTS